MKLTYLIHTKRKLFSRRMLMLFFSVCCVLANAQQQQVRISGNNLSLKSVFKQIELQTKMSVDYEPKLINTDKILQKAPEGKTLRAVIEELFPAGSYTVIYQGIHIIIKAKESGGKRLITGVICDAAGSIIGANVIEKGTTNGVITDLDGKFSIEAGSKSILQISCIGYTTQELLVGEKNSINVTMQESMIGLSEVVAIGYGSRKKESLTGSITQIKASEILTTKSTNLVSSLQGKVSGVQIRQQTGEPGQFTSMMSIRGFGTPLIVIDGVARDGTSEFERLNQEDIESISVLKDASAAIYGINADNGVIIVTTKKGSKGKAKFSYTGFYGITAPTVLQKSVNAYTSMFLRNEMDLNSGKPVTFSDDMLEKYRIGTEAGYQDYDWVGNSLKNTASQQQHNLSVSGGGENVNYYASFGWVENNGILNSNIQKYDKYNFRNNVAINITKGLVANINLAGRYDQNKAPQGSFFWLMKPIMTADRRFGPHTISNPTHITSIPGNSNPYALMTEDVSGYDKWEEIQYQASVDLNYEVPFLKGLQLRVLGAYDGNVRNTSNLKKNYYQYDYYTDSPIVPANKSTYNNSNTLFSRKDFQAQISYDNTFANAHHVGATMVYEVKSTDQNYLYAQRQWDDVYTNDILDQADLTNQSNKGNRTETAFMSLLGRFNYDYNSKYLVEFAFRRDGSYRYAPSKRWGFFPSISAGWRVSEERFFKENIPAVTNFKIRASYGMIGADPENAEAFQYVGGYTVGDIDRGYVFNNDILTKGMIPQGVINDNLTWIKTKTANIGIDLDLWQKKISIAADIFQKDRTGLLGYRQISVPNTFGASFPQENLNSDRVKGIEVMVSHRNQVNEITYGVSANVTYTRTQKVYTEKQPYGNSWEKWHDVNADGRLLGALWGFDYDGVYTNIQQYETAPLYNGYWGQNKANSMNLPGSLRITDSNGDGKINDNDKLPLLWGGQNNPPLQYGFTFDIKWRNFDFNMLLQGAALYTVTYASSDMWGYGTHAQITDKFLDRWHTESPNADPFNPNTVWIPGKFPALKLGVKSGTTDEFATDMWNMNAAYLRVKSLEFGYTLPQSFCNTIGIDNLRVYVNAYNLFTFSSADIKKFDPERHEGQYNADLTYPLMKSYNLGLTLNF